MLKNYPAASNDFADFQTRVDEELHGAGRNADGTQMGVVDRSLSINKENQKGGSHFDAETFPKVVAREKTGSNVAWNTSGSQHTGVHKAQSSVASQLYQAHGQLPQYDGAADSLSSGGAPASSDRASDKVGDAKAKVKLAGWLSSVSPSLYEPGRRLLVSERRHREAIDKLFQAIRKVEREEIANYKAKFVVKDSQLARSFQSEP